MDKEEFINEVKKFGIIVDNKKMEMLEVFYTVLERENKKYNLTRIIDKKDVYLKHFYDSLSLIKVVDIENMNICDIGSGAGFPGLVLAIFFPNCKITLIESNCKKCNFLRMVKEELSLQNVTIINARAEEYAKENREIFDIVTARAVAALKHLLEYSVPLVKVNGFFIAMKSNIDKEEENIENYYNKLKIKKIDSNIFYLPNENSLRSIFKYQKLEKTNKIYPRRFSEIKKRDI